MVVHNEHRHLRHVQSNLNQLVCQIIVQKNFLAGNELILMKLFNIAVMQYDLHKKVNLHLMIALENGTT